MSVSLVPLPDEFLLRRQTHGFFDDFLGTIVTADFWTTLVADVADGGATAIRTIDGVGGILSVSPEDATDNDEVSIESTREFNLLAANKTLVFEARVQFTEANTDDANIYVGLMDAVGANAMVDNGAGPKTSGSHLGFFKVDGGTNWKVHVSLSTTQTSTELTAANSLDGVVKTAGGASYQVLRIEATPYNSTNAKVDFFIDDVHVYSIDYVYTSQTEMQIGLVCKNGGANAETLKCDYVGCYQKR